MKELKKLADEIVARLVDCESADPEPVEQYKEWTRNKIAEAFRALKQRAEAAESENSYMGGGARYWHDEYCAQQKRLVAKIVDLEAKLTELEKQDAGGNPVLLYADSYRTMAKSGVTAIPIWSVITDLERNISPLFTRPLPSVSLAELVPEERFRYQESDYDDGHTNGWNACRAEMLRKIEEAK